ncbi:unnamed protein product, partial [Scytosiphon promiscuus]
MTAAALGKSLSKDPAIRFSRWSTTHLTSKQIDYACLDAYAAVLLHAEISKFKDPIFSEAPSEAPPPGTKVRLYTNNHASCVAVGQVQSEEEACTLLSKWGTPLKLVGRAGTRSGGLKRVVVKVIDVFKPASLVPHNDAPPPEPDARRRVSIKDVISGDGFALWDLAHVRLASAYNPFRGTPLSGSGVDPGAYDDEFFDAPRPAQGVYPDDQDTESDAEAEDESSDDDALNESGAGAASSPSGGPSASESGADVQEGTGGMFSIRLDLFHALNRLSRTIKKR